MTQKTARLPMAYGGTAQAHVGRGTLMRRAVCRASAIMTNTEAMNSSWPISTPTLKNSSAMGIDFCGRPISEDLGLLTLVAECPLMAISGHLTTP